MMTEKEKAERYDHIKEINKRSFLRRQTWLKLMLAKAAKAKVTVSDAEVEAELRRLSK